MSPFFVSGCIARRKYCEEKNIQNTTTKRTAQTYPYERSSSWVSAKHTQIPTKCRVECISHMPRINHQMCPPKRDWRFWPIDLWLICSIPNLTWKLVVLIELLRQHWRPIEAAPFVNIQHKCRVLLLPKFIWKLTVANAHGERNPAAWYVFCHSAVSATTQSAQMLIQIMQNLIKKTSRVPTFLFLEQISLYKQQSHKITTKHKRLNTTSYICTNNKKQNQIIKIAKINGESFTRQEFIENQREIDFPMFRLRLTSSLMCCNLRSDLLCVCASFDECCYSKSNCCFRLQTHTHSIGRYSTANDFYRCQSGSHAHRVSSQNYLQFSIEFNIWN